MPTFNAAVTKALSLGRRIGLSAILAFLTACSVAPLPGTPSIIAPPSSGNALVVVYRPKTFDHALRTPTIHLNGRPTCDLPNAHALKQEIAPGEVFVTATLWDWPGTSRIAFSAEADRTYLIRMEPNSEKRLAGLIGGHPGVWIAEAFSEKSGPYVLDIMSEQEGTLSLTGTQPVICPPEN